MSLESALTSAAGCTFRLYSLVNGAVVCSWLELEDGHVSSVEPQSSLA